MSVEEDSRRQNAEKLANLLTQMRKPPDPLEKLPCAYTIPANQWNCPKTGTMFCTGCRLVAYCSKECQKCHWTTHKGDCKDRLRSQTWQPMWKVEKRQPTFTEGVEEERLGGGMALWANMPAFDLLNLASNEGVDASRESDISIAIPAFCDLRDVITTVNAVPEDYTGTLNIVLSDKEPIAVARNIAILLLLTGSTLSAGGSPVDPALAAEVALHFWASTYVSPESDFRLVFTLSNFLGMLFDNRQAFEGESEEIAFDIPLGDNSRIGGSLPGIVLACLHEWGKRDALRLDFIEREMERIRYTPSRRDVHDRHYCRLEPSHRASFEKYRKDGMALPFGARRDRFDAPNRLLFSPKGQWLQNDLANPLGSWDIESVISAGKAHGTSREDLYGCLYFFLSDTFSKFSERIRRFHINFEFFCADPSYISSRLKDTSSASPSLRQFDRIQLSYLVDPDTTPGKLSEVLKQWSPLLKPKKDSCIMGDFQFWNTAQKGASVNTLPAEVTADILMQYVQEGKITDQAGARPQDPNQLGGNTIDYYETFNAALENSASFREYLETLGLQEALAKNKLNWKVQHTILPYRLGVSPHEPNTLRSLPSFLQDREQWYLNTCVGSWSWIERFIEFTRDD